jgi:cytochrome c oxidase assembly factor CtaG
MSFEAGPALALLVLGALYVRAVRALGRRGYRVPAGQQALWWSGFACLAAAFFSPLDAWAPKLLASHMAQHVLMADIATPLLLIGVRNPVLQFFLPRPVLVPLARRAGLRRVLRALRSPRVAIPVYTLVLVLWHLAPLFEGALRNQFVHGLQHQSFILFSAFVWWPIVEPDRRRMPGHLWKIPYILGARLPTMFLGMAFIVSTSAVYSGFYGNGPRKWGISALSDQQFAGSIMMSVDVITLMVVLAVVFWRAAADDDAKDEGQVQPGMKMAGVR